MDTKRTAASSLTHAAILISLLATQLVRLFSNASVLIWLADALLLLFLAYEGITSKGAPRRMFAILLAMTIVTWLVVEDPDRVIQAALAQGGFLGAYLGIVSLLQYPARRSRSVSDLGLYVTMQPPKRRYLGLVVAAQGLGAMLMFAVVSLFAPLIDEGVRRSGSDPLRAAIRKERQVLALFRGFTWMVIWGPTTAAQALLHRAMPELDDLRLHTTGLVIAGTAVIAGYLDDTIRFRRVLVRHPELAVPSPTSPPRPAFPTRATLFILALVTAMAAGSFGLARLYDLALTEGLMLIVPALVIGWTVLQVWSGSPDAGGALGPRLKTLALAEVPNAQSQVYLFGFVGIVATFIAALAAPFLQAQADTIAAIPAFPFLVGLALLVLVVSLFALSPIIVIIVLGSVVSSLPVLPADSTSIALAMLTAWAVSSTLSPNSFVSIFVAQQTGSDRMFLWRRNIWFNLASVAIMVAALAVFAL